MNRRRTAYCSMLIGCFVGGAIPSIVRWTLYHMPVTVSGVLSALIGIAVGLIILTVWALLIERIYRRVHRKNGGDA